MKIVSIFVNELYAFHYDNEADNEFDRLMDLWTDVNYLHQFAKTNNVTDIPTFINNILAYAEEIDNHLNNIQQNKLPYGMYFEPLQESERKRITLPLQKGKRPQNRLRLYAIKIDNNCYVITGGAIKMSQKMEDHPDTAQELIKLEKARSHLQEQGVLDEDSFFELLLEDL